jgi:hypothetical protein
MLEALAPLSDFATDRPTKRLLVETIRGVLSQLRELSGPKAILSDQCNCLVNELHRITGMLSRRGVPSKKALNELASALRMSGVVEVAPDADEAIAAGLCDGQDDDDSLESEPESDSELDMAEASADDPVEVVNAYKLIRSLEKLRRAVRFDLLGLLRATYRNATSESTSYMLVRAHAL